MWRWRGGGSFGDGGRVEVRARKNRNEVGRGGIGKVE